VDNGGERPAGRDTLGAVIVSERQGRARLADTDQVDPDLRGPVGEEPEPLGSVGDGERGDGALAGKQETGLHQVLRGLSGFVRQQPVPELGGRAPER